MLETLFGFKGRLSRAGFIESLVSIVLIDVAVTIAVKYVEAYGLPGGLGPRSGAVSALAGWTPWVLLIFTVWSLLAVAVKRCHDRERPGLMILIGFIPVIGWLWLLIDLVLLPGTSGRNRYGRQPHSHEPDEPSSWSGQEAPAPVAAPVAVEAAPAAVPADTPEVPHEAVEPAPAPEAVAPSAEPLAPFPASPVPEPSTAALDWTGHADPATVGDGPDPAIALSAPAAAPEVEAHEPLEAHAISPQEPVQAVAAPVETGQVEAPAPAEPARPQPALDPIAAAYAAREAARSQAPA